MNNVDEKELNKAEEQAEQEVNETELDQVSGGHFHYKGAGVKKKTDSEVTSHGSGASGSW